MTTKPNARCLITCEHVAWTPDCLPTNSVVYRVTVFLDGFTRGRGGSYRECREYAENVCRDHLVNPIFVGADR